MWIAQNKYNKFHLDKRGNLQITTGNKKRTIRSVGRPITIRHPLYNPIYGRNYIRHRPYIAPIPNPVGRPRLYNQKFPDYHIGYKKSLSKTYARMTSQEKRQYKSLEQQRRRDNKNSLNIIQEE